MQYFHHQNTFQLKLVNALIGYRANLRVNGGRELRRVSLNKKTIPQDGFGGRGVETWSCNGMTRNDTNYYLLESL
jgi:hypothetical protein